MKYVFKNQEFKTYDDLRAAYPNVLFPAPCDEAALHIFGIGAVEEEQSEAEQPLAAAKYKRWLDLEELTVTVDGFTFDADEVSQSRMTRVIEAMQAVNKRVTTKIQWVMADDTVEEITLQQLKAALAEAMRQTTEIWVRPYAE